MSAAIRLGPRHDVPFRDRELVADADGQLADPTDPRFAVVLGAGVVAQMSDLAAAGAPSETAGLLLGRKLRDGTGGYTLVAAVIESRQASTSPGSVTLDARAIEELHRRAVREHPELDRVGWWHSHGARSGFSRPDRATQAEWRDADDVGLLTFMKGDPFPVGYRGPGSIQLVTAINRCGPVTKASGALRQQTSSDRHAASECRQIHSETVLRRTNAPGPRPLSSRRLALAAVAVSVASLLVSVAWFFRAPRSVAPRTEPRSLITFQRNQGTASVVDRSTGITAASTLGPAWPWLSDSPAPDNYSIPEEGR